MQGRRHRNWEPNQSYDVPEGCPAGHLTTESGTLYLHHALAFDDEFRILIDLLDRRFFWGFFRCLGGAFTDQVR